MTGPLGAADFPASIGDRWFEDYVAGSIYEFGHASLSETEIVAFARPYEPQSIHTDPAWSAT
jgi:acyl dehydratase